MNEGLTLILSVYMFVTLVVISLLTWLVTQMPIGIPFFQYRNHQQLMRFSEDSWKFWRPMCVHVSIVCTIYPVISAVCFDTFLSDYTTNWIRVGIYSVCMSVSVVLILMVCVHLLNRFFMRIRELYQWQIPEWGGAIVGIAMITLSLFLSMKATVFLTDAIWLWEGWI